MPASKAQWSTYIKLRETGQEQVHTILDEVVKHPGTPGSETHMIADLYLSFVDENARGPRYRSTDMGALLESARDELAAAKPQQSKIFPMLAVTAGAFVLVV